MLRDEKLEPAISNASRSVCYCVIILRNAITTSTKEKHDYFLRYICTCIYILVIIKLAQLFNSHY